MPTTPYDVPDTALVPAAFPSEAGEVVEVSLLLSARQITALEEAAHHRGLTAGEMVRRLLGEFIRNPTAAAF